MCDVSLFLWYWPQRGRCIFEHVPPMALPRRVALCSVHFCGGYSILLAVAGHFAVCIWNVFSASHSVRLLCAFLCDMTWTRAYFAGWAVVACATPVVNVIAEPPAGSSEASSGAGLLEATVAELVSFARDVREEQRRVGARGKDLLAAHPSAIAYQKGQQPAASFVDIGGAHSDAVHLSSLLAQFASSSGASSSESLARPGFEIPDAEKRVRKLLMAAAHSFSDAAGVAAAQGASTAASFLQPVDANRLRGSLRATEAMRASPPMAVNVLVAEDLRGMQRDAQQRGAAEQLEALRQSFEDDLISLDAV